MRRWTWTRRDARPRRRCSTTQFKASTLHDNDASNTDSEVLSGLGRGRGIRRPSRAGSDARLIALGAGFGLSSVAWLDLLEEPGPRSHRCACPRLPFLTTTLYCKLTGTDSSIALRCAVLIRFGSDPNISHAFLSAHASIYLPANATVKSPPFNPQSHPKPSPTRPPSPPPPPLLRLEHKTSPPHSPRSPRTTARSALSAR